MPSIGSSVQNRSRYSLVAPRSIQRQTSVGARIAAPQARAARTWSTTWSRIAAFSGCRSSAESSSAMIGSSGNASASARQIDGLAAEVGHRHRALVLLGQHSPAGSPPDRPAQPRRLADGPDGLGLLTLVKVAHGRFSSSKGQVLDSRLLAFVFHFIDPW